MRYCAVSVLLGRRGVGASLRRKVVESLHSGKREACAWHHGPELAPLRNRPRVPVSAKGGLCDLVFSGLRA
jgi:hypothetical protein